MRERPETEKQHFGIWNIGVRIATLMIMQSELYITVVSGCFIDRDAMRLVTGRENYRSVLHHFSCLMWIRFSLTKKDSCAVLDVGLVVIVQHSGIVLSNLEDKFFHIRDRIFAPKCNIWCQISCRKASGTNTPTPVN